MSRVYTRELLMAFIESHSERITETGCQIWLRALATKGYCQIWIDGHHKLVHRVTWELHYGPVPDGLCVLHRCDIPCCVNHAHLFIGTRQDNAIDASRKGRSVGFRRKGSNHPITNLTEVDVIAIRADQRKYKEIAKDYGIGETGVCLIKTRKTWTHI